MTTDLITINHLNYHLSFHSSCMELEVNLLDWSTYKWTSTWKVKGVVETCYNLARLVLTIDCSPETRLTYLSWAIATISMLVKHSITSTHIVQYYHQNAAAICCAALKKKVSHSRQIGLVKMQMFLKLIYKSLCFYPEVWFFWFFFLLSNLVSGWIMSTCGAPSQNAKHCKFW